MPITIIWEDNHRN